MKKNNIICYAIICLIVIVGLIMWKTKGFKREILYSTRYEIELSNNTGINSEDIEKICKEELGNTNFFVQNVENFGNSVLIVSEKITDEQKNKIVEKFNEKYALELSNEDIKIEKVPFTRIKDILKKYMSMGVTVFVIILVYFGIRFYKYGLKEVLIKTAIFPIVAELTLFSLIAIARIPFGRFTISLGIGVYAITVFILTNIFENKRQKYLKEFESKKEA